MSLFILFVSALSFIWVCGFPKCILKQDIPENVTQLIDLLKMLLMFVKKISLREAVKIWSTSVTGSSISNSTV